MIISAHYQFLIMTNTILNFFIAFNEWGSSAGFFINKSPAYD